MAKDNKGLWILGILALVVIIVLQGNGDLFATYIPPNSECNVNADCPSGFECVAVQTFVTGISSTNRCVRGGYYVDQDLSNIVMSKVLPYNRNYGISFDMANLGTQDMIGQKGEAVYYLQSSALAQTLIANAGNIDHLMAVLPEIGLAPNCEGDDTSAFKLNIPADGKYHRFQVKTKTPSPGKYVLVIGTYNACGSDGGTGYVTFSLVKDVNVYSYVYTPSTEINCYDGLDNDFDGYADGEDIDCGSGEPVPPPSITCEDTDNGKNKEIYGEIKLNGEVKFKDQCTDKSKLVEYFCDNSLVAKYNSMYVSCDTNQECKDGACVTSSTIPTSKICYACDGGELISETTTTGVCTPGYNTPAPDCDKLPDDGDNNPTETETCVLDSDGITYRCLSESDCASFCTSLGANTNPDNTEINSIYYCRCNDRDTGDIVTAGDGEGTEELEGLDKVIDDVRNSLGLENPTSVWIIFGIIAILLVIMIFARKKP